MRVRIKTLAVPVVAGVVIAVAALAYGGTAVVTAATKQSAKAKYEKALKTCKKKDKKKSKKSKKKLKKCDATAKKAYEKELRKINRGTTTGSQITTTTAGNNTTGTTNTTTTTTSGAAGTTGASTATTTTGTAATTTSTAGTTTTGKPTAAEVAAGQTLFDKTCTTCHGAHGEGMSGIAPPYSELPRAQSILGVIEQLTDPINEKPVPMPNYNTMYTAAEKEEIAAYITVELTKTVQVVGGTGTTTTTGTGTTTSTSNGTTTSTGTTTTATTTTGTTTSATTTTGTTTTGTTTTGNGTTTSTGTTTGGTETKEEEEEKREAEEDPKLAAFKENTAPETGKVKTGERLFAETCATCHGTHGEGEGAVGPDLQDSSAYPRAASVKGVIEQLIKPASKEEANWSYTMPPLDLSYTFTEKEEIGDFVCVEISKKCS